MYIQFVEQANPNLFKSPVLYIHCDEEEFKQFLNKYLEDLFKGFPLGRLEAPTVMCDFMHKLTLYYIENTGNLINSEGRIISWMRLLDRSYLEGDISELELIELQKP